MLTTDFRQQEMAIFSISSVFQPIARKRANSQVMKRVNLAKLLITNKVKSIFRRNRKMGI